MSSDRRLLTSLPAMPTSIEQLILAELQKHTKLLEYIVMLTEPNKGKKQK